MSVAVAPPQSATRIAQRLVAVLALGAMVVALGLAMSTRDVDIASDRWGFRAFPALHAVVFTVVGYIVATRRPRNLIGWLLLGLGAGAGTQVLAQEYGIYDAHGPQRLPGAALVAWIDGWIWVPALATTLCIIPALFPDGRPLSSRWRPLLWLTGTLTALTTLLFAFGPATMANSNLANPLSIGELGAGSPILFVPFAALGACGIASVLSLALRFRRAAIEERQQLKWLAFAASLVTLTFLPNALIDPTNPPKAAQVLLVVAYSLVPVAIGIAVLRYRLYEIDTLINRTLVYGALTALIAGLFVATQTLLQRTLVAMTGMSSDISVVLALFVIATAIAPLKTRLQQAVDARFRPASSATHGRDGSSLVSTQLRELAQLRAEGILTEEEFASKKKELLERI